MLETKIDVHGSRLGCWELDARADKWMTPAAGGPANLAPGVSADTDHEQAPGSLPEVLY